MNNDENIKRVKYNHSEVDLRMEEERDKLIECYNKKTNENVLSTLLKMKLSKGDNSIKNNLKFKISHRCEEGNERCLDEMIFDIDTDNDDKNIFVVDYYCVCFCEEGMSYFFRVFKLINPTKLRFNNISIQIQYQSLFGSLFSQLSSLEEIELHSICLASDFVESFVKSIPLMKLKHIHLSTNPIGSKGFKLLLPYLHLLINKDDELDLWAMNLSDESMILLSSELYKYPNVKKINITTNNIHSRGLKALFSKFPISKVLFDLNRSKELLIDKDIPDILKYIKYLDLSDLEIDDDYFKSFISLRSNELGEIEGLDLSNNKLAHKSIETLIDNLSSLSNLNKLQVYGNEIGDEGMKILSPHIHLLNSENVINCSKMGLSSTGLKYLLDGLKNIHKKIKRLDISGNNIDSSGIEYLMKYIKENGNIETISIQDNPIGNNGFKLLSNNLDMIKYDGKIDLSRISIDDESVILLTNKISSIGRCNTINLSGNDIRIEGLKLICSKSNWNYPFIMMRNSSWTDEELEYYLNYCVEKNRCSYKSHDFSNMNINDCHISLIKQINYKTLYLSHNIISAKGLKELTDSLSQHPQYISIFNNPIGDEGIEIICKYINRFIDCKNVGCGILLSLCLSNIDMSEKGLRTLIEKLKEGCLEKIDISGNELNERELRLMIENKEVFECLEDLFITMKKDIDISELKSFLKTFSSIKSIKIDGISEEEKKGLSEEFFNIK